uniref:Uncharacterized protein n=1 Tax=Anguilla anguilla TaxID=7936 RepID=A0A0E9T549_ANGAN
MSMGGRGNSHCDTQGLSQRATEWARIKLQIGCMCWSK